MRGCVRPTRCSAGFSNCSSNAASRRARRPTCRALRTTCGTVSNNGRSTFHRSGLTDTARGLLLYTVAQMGRSRVTGEPVVEATEDLLEATRFAIGPAIGHALAGLRRERGDQAAYAEHALAIAAVIGEMIEQTDEADADAASEESGARNDPAFSLLLDFDGEIEDGIADAQSRDSRVLGEAKRWIPCLHHCLRPGIARRCPGASGAVARISRATGPAHRRAGLQHRPAGATAEGAACGSHARRLGRRPGGGPRRRPPAGAAGQFTGGTAPVSRRSRTSRLPMRC